MHWLPRATGGAVAAIVLAAGSPCAGGPHAGGHLVFHCDTSVQFTSDRQTYCDVSYPLACSILSNTAHTTDVVIIHLLAAFADGVTPSLAAASFGVAYLDDISIIATAFCAEAVYADAAWPESGTGVSLFLSPPRRDSLVPLCWFAAYDPYAAPAVLQVTPRVDTGTFADDSVPAQLDEAISFGRFVFFGADSVQCPDPSHASGPSAAIMGVYNALAR